MPDMPQTADICDMDAGGLIARYASGELSPVEVVSDIFDRIERFNPVINAFCHLDAEGALLAARQSEARWRRDRR